MLFRSRRDGINLYAHWRDGVQYVGTTGCTLKQALEYIDQDEAKTMARFDMLKPL